MASAEDSSVRCKPIAYREFTRLIAAGKSAEVEKKWRSHMDRVARYLAESGMAKVRVGVLSWKGAAAAVLSATAQGDLGYFFIQAVHQPLPFTVLAPKISHGALAALAAPL